MDPAPPPLGAYSNKRVLSATAAAAIVASGVLLLAVLPAEYGIDPTGIGKLAGLTSLSAQGTRAEGDPFPLPAPESRFIHEGSWPTTSTEVARLEGYAAEGATQDLTVPLTLHNLTRLTATLSWTDDNATDGNATQPDLFQVQLVAPDGRASAAVLGRNAPGGAGNATATFQWRTAPHPREFEAVAPREAAERFRAIIPTDDSGKGDWRIRVTLLEAGAGTPEAPGEDAGNQWNLTVTAETFSLSQKSDPRNRHDVVHLTIPPGEGLEFKLHMDKDENVTYSWTADGMLYFDFHGDQDGAPASAFTSYMSNDAKTDRGTLTAPFKGRHGWYWENIDHARAITLRLETRGTYTVIGKV